MTAWSQSLFLQAFGWAMLNSLWQMALLYTGFKLLLQSNRLSTLQKYYLTLGSLGAGFSWFGLTFFSFYKSGSAVSFLSLHFLTPNFQSWNFLFASASLAYMVLLVPSACRLLASWRHIGHLKKFGLQKTAPEYRLFVKKIAAQLGIKPTVQLYVSKLVQSPLTIGYLKPVILVPIGALNSLTPQQVEAVLLHELAHIRRYDYIVNFIITLLQTLFYFNPFVKKFISAIESEREQCCDELVLQFEYDRISYASALLFFEKNRMQPELLAIAATGKKHLLGRIEKIIGVEKRSSFSFSQFTGLVASIIILIFINVLFSGNEQKQQENGKDLSFAAFENPLLQFNISATGETFSKAHAPSVNAVIKKKDTKLEPPIAKQFIINNSVAGTQAIDDHVVAVTYDASDELVSNEEKEQIEQALESTKEVLAKTKWKEIETAIADGMTATEKKAAKREYLEKLDSVDWKNLEKYLKSEYDNLNWDEIEAKLNSAVADFKLDSLQATYHDILSNLQTARTKVNKNGNTFYLPIPDASVRELDTLKSTIETTIDSIQTFRKRKVVHF